ncbi:hypothetical protein Fmac_017928 [Flemingia macrophylla]|uniref:Uncharacterized protein n=1 Tax=Flemingia macrophylla TaxID=520843 RepID=A0ABD1M3Z6_9FABA
MGEARFMSLSMVEVDEEGTNRKLCECCVARISDQYLIVYKETIMSMVVVRRG